MEVFATGLGLGESPRWHDGRLWVCDWVAGEVLSFDDDGERRVELMMTGLPFSVDWLPDGRTVLTSSEGVVTADADGTLTAYGASGQGWNEIVVDARGNTFVNAAGFDLMAGDEPQPGLRLGGAPRRLVGRGGPRRVVPQRDGGHPRRHHAAGRRVLRPLPDCVRHAPTARLSGRRVWADLGDAAPDGICLDAEGAVWYADVPHRRCVRVAEGGEVLEVVEADRGCFACMLGAIRRSHPVRRGSRTGVAPAGSAPASGPARCSPTGRPHRTRVAPSSGRRVSPRVTSR